MKIIYVLAIEEDGLRSAEERQWLSGLMGHLETQAHQWMLDQHPEVDFYTQRLAPTVSRYAHYRLADCRQHHQVCADTQADQERGEQILAALQEYIGQQWKAWRVERVVGNGSAARLL